MKVLIDEGLSTLQQLGGIGYFSLNLWKHLQQYVECDITDFRRLRSLPRAAKRAIYLGLANLQSYSRKYDLIHYQNYYVPRSFGKAKSVATIHDLGGLKSADAYPAWYNTYFRNVVRNAVRRSDAITVSSYAACRDLLMFFPNIDESRVFVCHHGVRSSFFELHPTTKEISPFGLKPYSYFLFIGNLERRKNLGVLLSQFISARKKSLVSPETRLVLVGKPIPYDDFSPLISAENNIVHLGRLSDEQLVALYRYCKALLFPSMYEGFGLPILEAMSQHAPILISNTPSSLELNERHNKQCLVFELGKNETLVELLSHLDKQSDEIRSKLNYGDLSIYLFDRVAREHLKVYEKVLHR